MEQQDTTEQHKCIKITNFWHKIHVIQYICTNALEELPDSASDITLKMETAGTPEMLVPMYDIIMHHIPDTQCHKNLKYQQNHNFLQSPHHQTHTCLLLVVVQS